MRLTRFSGPAIVATAHHLPTQVVRTDELGIGDPDELVRLTGIERRHVAPPELATSDLITRAAQPIVDAHRASIDRLFVATVTPDHPSPATAPLVQHQLGLPSIPALDLSAACAGFVYAIDLAARSVMTGDRAVLVGAGECRFRTLDRALPGVRTLFGDGAAAALVSGDASLAGDRVAPSLAIVATCLGSDGRHHGAVRVPAGGSRMPTTHETVERGEHALRMDDGPTVFYQAVEGFLDVARAILDPLGLRPDDIDLVVPHQPNLRILERVARILRIPLDRFAIDVASIGNVGGASAPIVLDRALASGRIARGQRILLLTAGAGFVGGAAILEAT